MPEREIEEPACLDDTLNGLNGTFNKYNLIKYRICWFLHYELRKLDGIKNFDQKLILKIIFVRKLLD